MLGENWGAPFVFGFIVLLVVAAVFLAVGSEWLASEVANYGALLKYGEKGGNDD